MKKTGLSGAGADSNTENRLVSLTVSRNLVANARRSHSET